MKRFARRRFVVRRRTDLVHELYLEVDRGFIRFDIDKGPSPSPIEARAAVEREMEAIDDPFLESVASGLVWDIGAVEPMVDLEEGIRRGKLLFSSLGHKMKGTFTLGRSRGTPRGRGRPWLPSKDWVLLKKPDAWADRKGHYSPRSVLSGLALGEDGSEIRERIGGLISGLPARDRWTSFMEAGKSSLPFSSLEFLFEIDARGLRVLASRSGFRGDAAAERFPEIRAALRALPTDVEIDGQIVVLDREGRPDPTAIALRAEGRATDLDHPAILFALDLVSAENKSLASLSLEKRKAILKLVSAGIGPIVMADHIAERGDSLADAIAGRGFSILARRRTSKYAPGKSEDWIAVEVPESLSAPASAARPRSVEGLEGLAVELTNLDKVFWPEEGYTKGDLLRFYRSVAPALLPHLSDRPVVLTRYPDGIHGKSFFQHNAPGAKSGWLRTVRIEMSRRPRDYFLADDLESLLYLVNLGTIPIHVWPSRVESIERPDWCIIDLDRGERGFDEVVEVALLVRKLCEAIELPSFPKTSGGGGIHVLIPLGALLSYDQSRALGELIARTIADANPTLATIELTIANRGGRVFIDHLVNARGRMLVSPYAVRPLPGATVSTPLSWDEVERGLDPRAFTIETVPPRLEAIGDPWASFHATTADVPRALELLSLSLRTC